MGWSNRALTVMVAPWDWDMLAWSLPTYFPLARRGKLLIAYNVNGAANKWKSLQEVPTTPHPVDLQDRLTQLFDLANDAGIRCCKALPHDLTSEHGTRNLMLEEADSRINITPDADEYLLDTDKALEGVERVKARGTMAAGFFDWKHVVGFDGERVRCLESDKPLRSPMVVDRQAVWCGARVVVGYQVNIAASVWHWRIPRGASHLKYRTYTDSTESHTFEGWLMSAREGEGIPEGFEADAESLRGNGGRMGPWQHVNDQLIPPQFRKDHTK